MKFADILYLPGILHHLLQNTQIRSENLDCRSKNVVYLISCKFVTNHITGSSEEFRARVTDYRFARRNYRKNMKVKLCIYICVCVCVCVCVCLCVYICLYLYLYMYIYFHICIIYIRHVVLMNVKYQMLLTCLTTYRKSWLIQVSKQRNPNGNGIWWAHQLLEHFQLFWM